MGPGTNRSGKLIQRSPTSFRLTRPQRSRRTWRASVSPVPSGPGGHGELPSHPSPAVQRDIESFGLTRPQRSRGTSRASVSPVPSGPGGHRELRSRPRPTVQGHPQGFRLVHPDQCRVGQLPFGSSTLTEPGQTGCLLDPSVMAAQAPTARRRRWARTTSLGPRLSPPASSDPDMGLSSRSFPSLTTLRKASTTRGSKWVPESSTMIPTA